MNLSVNSPRVLLLLVVSVVAGLIAAAMFWSAPQQSRAAFERTGIFGGAAQLAKEVADVAATAAGSMLSRARSINPTEAPAAPEVAGTKGDAKTKTAPPAPRASRAPVAAAAAPAPVSSTTPPAAGEVEQAQTPAQDDPAATDPAAGAASEAFPLDDQVYTSQDPGVVPPHPLQRLLARDPAPGVDPDSLALVEFVVDQRGNVEVVDLVRESGRRVPDSMLLAAIKAWRFEPALKDGHPVKYRQTVRVTY